MRCEKCGESHARCTGHSKRTGKPCGGMPISGHHVCRMHSNGVTKAVAKRNVAEQKAAKAISRESLVPVSDPVAALMALAAEALRWKDYFAERIANLETLRFQAGAGEQIRGELLLWERGIERAQPFNRVPVGPPGSPLATAYASPIAVLRRLSNSDKHQTLLFQLPFPEPLTLLGAIGWSDQVNLVEHRITGLPISMEVPTEIV